MIDGTHVDPVCHKGYFSALDGRAKVVRWVAYELTGPHTLGCFSREGLQFKVDALAPAEDQARLGDYAHSLFDLGHMAPNQDFAWDAGEQRDTFSFANVAPQRHVLNRQGWERGEEIVRAWALQRGDVEVYVGPILLAGDTTLGTDKVEVPSAFYKVVVDRNTHEAIGFVLPQEDIPKGPLDPFLHSIADIQAKAHVNLPLPTPHTESSTVWPADLSHWNSIHKDACPR
jgi:endonuclease G